MRREQTIRCSERQPLKPCAALHPGWIRATSVLFIGMARIHGQEAAGRRDEEKDRR